VRSNFSSIPATPKEAPQRRRSYLRQSPPAQTKSFTVDKRCDARIDGGGRAKEELSLYYPKKHYGKQVSQFSQAVLQTLIVSSGCDRLAGCLRWHPSVVVY